MPNQLVFMLATETISKAMGKTYLRSTSLKSLRYLDRRSSLKLENVKIAVRSIPDRAPQMMDNASSTQSPRQVYYQKFPTVQYFKLAPQSMHRQNVVKKTVALHRGLTLHKTIPFPVTSMRNTILRMLKWIMRFQAEPVSGFTTFAEQTRFHRCAIGVQSVCNPESSLRQGALAGNRQKYRSASNRKRFTRKPRRTCSTELRRTDVHHT
jgi:hypothetical protein